MDTLSPGRTTGEQDKEAEMSMIVFGQGRIARGNLGPAEDFVTRMRDGATVQELFRRCHVFVADLYAPPRKIEGGGTRTATQLVQLIFDGGPRHEKIFSWLRPGRQISFRGRLAHRARAFFDKEDLDEQNKPKLKVHPNPTVYIERIDFLDSPIEHTAERFLQALVDGGKIDPEKKAEMIACIKERVDLAADMPGNGPDKIGEPAPKGAPQEAAIVSEDDPFDAPQP
jgi:hypothetical protein